MLPSGVGTDVAINLEALCRGLMRSAAFGIPAAVPLDVVGSGVEVQSLLLTQVRSVTAEMQGRLSRIADVDRAFDRAQAKPEEQREHDLARLKTVFGSDFLALPHIAPANAAQLTETFTAS